MKGPVLNGIRSWYSLAVADQEGTRVELACFTNEIEPGHLDLTRRH